MTVSYVKKKIDERFDFTGGCIYLAGYMHVTGYFSVTTFKQGLIFLFRDKYPSVTGYWTSPRQLRPLKSGSPTMNYTPEPSTPLHNRCSLSL
ncbi:MAG: hypothetical protein VB074_10075 [Proteiniphilum sp.]|uniref:hypothetical protein n=1 Tax=Proteiniphilum sp. TaxID=1926877 RepID=UPI002B2067AD|nr:hypothetical protein [Proteiniphilum sp.]MEA5128522.1 hypothetical protein [Proteiniphilum sp.]